MVEDRGDYLDSGLVARRDQVGGERAGEGAGRVRQETHDKVPRLEQVHGLA